MVRSYKSKRKITLKKKRITKHSYVIKRKLRKSKKKFSKKSQRRYSKKRRVRKLNMQGGSKKLNEADLKKLLNDAKLKAFEYAKYLLGTKTGELITKGTLRKKAKYENVFKSGAFPGDPHFSKEKGSSTGIGIPCTLTGKEDEPEGTKTTMHKSLFDRLTSCSRGSPFFVDPDPPVKEYIDNSNGGYKYQFLNEIYKEINSYTNDDNILGLITLYRLPNLEQLQEDIVKKQNIPGCRRINALNYVTNRKDLSTTLTLANQDQGQFLFTLHLTLSMGSFLITICKSNKDEPHSMPLILSIDERSETTLALEKETVISEEAIDLSFINLSNHPEGNNTPLIATLDNAEMDTKHLPHQEAWSAPGLGLGTGPT